jgi:hypothetical protein
METLFLIRDPEGAYTSAQICALIETAEHQGYPIERGSYLEHMTVKQLARLTNGVYDA